MTRDWKTGELIEAARYRWKDPILNDAFGITQADWDTVIEQTAAHIRRWNAPRIAERTAYLVELLAPPLQRLWQGKNGEVPFRWLPCCSLPGATVADHGLIAAAIAYCLGYDNGFQSDLETLDRLRLSALTATWQEDGLGEVYAAVWLGLSPIVPNASGDMLAQIVHLAKTVASERLLFINSGWQPPNSEQTTDGALATISGTAAFASHPLKQANGLTEKQIGLVLGGATKVKAYFLESAKLPEIRGASALLERLNLEDIPALFGRDIRGDSPRAERLRDAFCERTGHRLSAPECIIYAAGGNTLAFTPASAVHEIADEMERLYSQETLVANSVAVGEGFDLLELQYGLNPTQFWSEEFSQACENPKTQLLMESSYGGTEKKDFFRKKCFGELTTKLARAQFHRREGNPTPHRTTRRALPTSIELKPYQERCPSCERRPAVIRHPRMLCEACTRKYVTGRIAKRTVAAEDLHHYLQVLHPWSPSNKNAQDEWCLQDWSSLFETYLAATGKVDNYAQSAEHLEKTEGPRDLKDIATASKLGGFVTFIYADGNNMGSYLENVATPAQYRQFSERVFLALQQATFDALAAQLTPTAGNRHPFEIVSIGGDDLVLIVPGSKAFEVVHAIGANFDRAFESRAQFAETLRPSQRYTPGEWADNQEMQPAISLSLGFVIAAEHTPIAFLEHLAASLLKSAKKRAKTLKTPDIGYLGGTADFLVLKSLSMITSELGDFRERFYHVGGEETVALTMRPFTLHELEGFIKTVRAFKDSEFPRSQLYQLRQSLHLGRMTSTLEYLYFRSRLRDGKGETLQRELEQHWQGAERGVDLGPWYPKGTEPERYETLLLDLIEAYDFIAGTDDGTERNDSGTHIS